MQILNESVPSVKLFDPEPWGPVFDQTEGLETAEWIRDQAERFRAMGSDLAELVAERLDDLAEDWRILSAGEPISVDDFRARQEVAQELAYSRAYD